MLRLVFSKTGDAVWMSHLDLMRLFQRAFKRAGLLLTHTQGFNQRPSVSIALPLSVGVESICELLDFELDNQELPDEEIQNRLNQALVSGVHVSKVYADGQKIKHLAYLDCELYLEYDRGVPEAALDNLKNLFEQPSLIVEKKGKNGVTEQDIIPMIRAIAFSQMDNCIVVKARVCCQNPTLNPMQIHAAIVKYAAQYAPDFVKYRRISVLDEQEKPFL